MNDYNRIAWVYDALAQWVFRGNILKSQIHFLNLIEPKQRVLIIGGGSGKVLIALDHLNMTLTIDFVEPAHAMIEKARRRSDKLHNLTINFHQTRFEDYHSKGAYDWVCCFYFLDLFKEDTLNQHLTKIEQIMSHRAQLMVADFQNPSGHIWMKILSRFMHLFFKLTTNLESNRLKDIHSLLANQGFKQVNKAQYFSQFIFSAVYQKEVS